jgi:hypothetical protein
MQTTSSMQLASHAAAKFLHNKQDNDMSLEAGFIAWGHYFSSYLAAS